MYSAKKVGGVRLYELARRGEQIARQPVEVEIKELELCPLTDGPANEEAGRFHGGADGTRDFSLRVVCSSGTYVRALAEDLGSHLGLGAHLIGLRRLRAGSCHVSQAVTLERLAELAETGAVPQVLVPMAEGLRMPELLVSEAERRLIAHGRAIHSRGAWPGGERVKLRGAGGELLAIAEFDAQTRTLQPRVVLA
jgi:tRNA pseudouridine55 synthase